MNHPQPYLVGLIGNGIGPSLTPALHMAEGRAQGLDYVYRTLDHNGLNITHPCKQLVLPHLDDIDEVAATLGAVNTVVFDGARAIGYNTDTTGFAHGVTEARPGAALDTVVLIGAGG